ncbi:MAG: phosphate acetyltransferase [Deferribacteraceae bacterium]|jgi:phosphate acetyltransferase|nr:phosphate acetyltransferase [Deferribacteraceae bacterium]
MSNLLESFHQKAATLNRTIVLPEGGDHRTIKAAATILKEKLAKLIILGDINTVTAALKAEGVDTSSPDIQVMEPAKDPKLGEYTRKYYEMRKAKGMTEEEASYSMINALYFGAMLVKEGVAHGSVAGATSMTADVLRAGLKVVGSKGASKTVSSFFIMDTNKTEFGENGTLLFADSAVNPDPNADQLADIAMSTAENCKLLLHAEPRIAMLSFSTKGSAEHSNTQKVATAVRTLRDRAPGLMVDGEMQLDAAIIPTVADRKAPGSTVAGRANILIFPNLDAGNIGYKLVERFADARAIGPIIQGFAKPINDLSRGCSAEDIVDMVAITSVQE